MAEQRGGYQRPANPAAVSGPGALSARTDGGPADPQPQRALPNAGYGEGKAFSEIQGGAAMAGGGGTPAPALPGLMDPTGRPEEPITAGADAGPGIGSEAAGIANDKQAGIQALLPILDSLEALANLPGANPQTRAYVRSLKAQS